MPTLRRAACCHTAAFALMTWLSTGVGPALAQQTAAVPLGPSLVDYFTRGADATSLPRPGQPGYDFYANGSQLFTIPQPGQPGADYYNQGARATSLPQSGQPGAEYFVHVDAYPSGDKPVSSDHVPFRVSE